MPKSKITEISAIKLEKGKKYLLVFDANTVQMKTLKQVTNAMADEGIRGLALGIRGGVGSVKIIEAH